MSENKEVDKAAQQASHEEATIIATMVVGNLQSDPETAICERMDKLTNRSADSNKVYLKTLGGEVYRFAVSPTKSRS